VIDVCDTAHSLPQIIGQLRQTLNGSMPEEAWVGEFVRYLSECRLALEYEGRYLSLIMAQAPPS
jgi:hypothetical protein